MKTIFITGSSSGIGKETAKLFAQNGWQVIATMRHPEKETELTAFPNVQLLPCDVTDEKSIQFAISEGIRIFGKIDVLLNNAGFYTIGPFEAATNAQIYEQVNTNLLGTLYTTKELLPHFRKNRDGLIINVSSIAGQISIPLQTLYHASKWGIEGFSESLQYELTQFGIRVKVIEPGVINTDFYRGSKTITDCSTLAEYRQYADTLTKKLIANGLKGSSANEVAQTIYKAATDGKNRLRYRCGASKNMPLLRRFLPLNVYMRCIKTHFS